MTSEKFKLLLDENGIPYSPVYLKTIHNQLSAMFNHAVRFSAVAIADRAGYESIDITYRYAHVFPSTQMKVVSKLNTIITTSCGCVEI